MYLDYPREFVYDPKRDYDVIIDELGYLPGVTLELYSKQAFDYLVSIIEHWKGYKVIKIANREKKEKYKLIVTEIYYGDKVVTMLMPKHYSDKYLGFRLSIAGVHTTTDGNIHLSFSFTPIIMGEEVFDPYDAM